MARDYARRREGEGIDEPDRETERTVGGFARAWRDHEWCTGVGNATQLETMAWPGGLVL